MHRNSRRTFTPVAGNHIAFILILLLLFLAIPCQGRSSFTVDTPAALAKQRPGEPQEESALSTRRFSYLHGGPVVQLAWFYKPPREEKNLESLAAHYDAFILTRRDEPVRDELRRQGKGPFLQYIRFDAIHDPCKQARQPAGSPCTCDESPLNNNVAWYSEDICRIRDNNPEWFLRGSDGEILYNDEFVWMDPAQQGWRDFWLQRASKSLEENGWDGVFLDNVEASLAKHTRLGVEALADYPSRESYQDAVEGFLRYIYENYFYKTGRPLLGNVIELRDESVWYRYLSYMDGAMEEAWGVGWSGGSLDRSRWETHMRRAERSQAMGKHIILVTQGSEDNARLQQFAFASYLLVANGRASFRYSDSSDYDRLWNYYNYHLADRLGDPLGPRYPGCDGWRRFVNCRVWRRDFVGGSVVVDLEQRHGLIFAMDANSPIRLPGRIEAENYRSGPSSAAYHDTSEGNEGETYRVGDVDIERCDDGALCYNVGWIRDGEWIAYPVEFSEDGKYIFNLRVASPEKGNRLHLELDGNDISGLLQVPETGSFGDWEVVESAPIRVKEGRYTLKIVFDGEHFNLNHIDVEETD